MNNPDVKPSVVREAFDAIAKKLTPASSVFEWGAGNSTVYFNTITPHTVTVEHSSKWYTNIMAALARRELIPERFVLVGPTTNGNPAFSSSMVKGSFEAYVKTIDDYPDETFDVVMVDGRARAWCIFAATTKVKPGGMLVIDDSNRKGYQDAILRLSGWDVKLYRGDGYGCHYKSFSTGIWVKPLKAEVVR